MSSVITYLDFSIRVMENITEKTIQKQTTKDRLKTGQYLSLSGPGGVIIIICKKQNKKNPTTM